MSTSHIIGLMGIFKGATSSYVNSSPGGWILVWTCGTMFEDSTSGASLTIYAPGSILTTTVGTAVGVESRSPFWPMFVVAADVP